MKMLSAALVVSQVMLAAGCRPAPCDEGCTLQTSYVRRVRFARGKCAAAGDVLDLFVPITSCDVVDSKPMTFGQCTSGQNGETVCTGRGSCLKLQLVRESRFSCDCPEVPVEDCESDRNCPLGEFCRAKKEGQMCAAKGTECVPYTGLGESCGGRRLPCFKTQCAPGTQCQGDGLAADRPGTCERVPVCLAEPACSTGSVEDPSCTRIDFAARVCHKEVFCGKEVACRSLPEL